MDAKVKELIDQDTKWWNRDLIDEKFLKRKEWL
jgi:predicted RNA polymerase sigma factor